MQDFFRLFFENFIIFTNNRVCGKIVVFFAYHNCGVWTLFNAPGRARRRENFTTNQQPKSVLLLTIWLPAGSQHEVFFGALHQKHGIVPSFSLFDLFNSFVMLFMSLSFSFWLLTKLSFSFFKNDLITP
ncbi:hypothetical protein ACLEIY_01240 [Acetobacter tropicalis]|uniref:hypothetical protein n=1 Tax=Acetobacter tropicalis TaxID=104102 RepID=UPI0039767B14